MARALRVQISSTLPRPPGRRQGDPVARGGAAV